ncbi:MAG: DUF4124 domain-containing protein [Gammaproteobacteria bacterium]
MESGDTDMDIKRLCLACLLMLAFSVPAAASEIYKRVDENGVVEFSDRPMEDSDRVEVNPNVVATSPVQRRERPAPRAASPAATPAPAAAPSRARASEDYSYTRNENRRDRAVRNEARERREQRSTRDQRSTRERSDDAVATDPNPGRALRNAARGL